jgi:hypothetical protein
MKWSISHLNAQCDDDDYQNKVMLFTKPSILVDLNDGIKFLSYTR